MRLAALVGDEETPFGFDFEGLREQRVRTGLSQHPHDAPYEVDIRFL